MSAALAGGGSNEDREKLVALTSGFAASVLPVTKLSATVICPRCLYIHYFCDTDGDETGTIRG